MSMDFVSPISADALRRIAADLSRLTAPNETAFIALGDALAAARSKLIAGGEQFRTLSDMFDQGDGADAGRALAEARDDVMRISSQSGEVGSGLGALAQSVATVGRPLTMLDKIIGEIAALATNAKVQAAQVTAAGVDFSVFTKDIDRLHGLAQEAIGQATARLSSLTEVMATACREARDFQDGDAAELVNVVSGLKGQLQELAQRRDQARHALGDFERRMAAVVDRVARCIGALQINDLTSQRIGHVQTALGLLCGIVEPHAVSEAGYEWIGDLDGDRKRLLLGTVCTLQATQLERAAADFAVAIGELKANLNGLAVDAAANVDESGRVFGGDHGDGTFIRAVLSDVERARRLLDNYCQADRRIRGHVETLSEGFSAMAGDLKAIQSIDADMRIMGLNATLKCTRLGREGLALGVVAQELRACSRRTEETSKAIAAAISTLSDQAVALSECSTRQGDAATAVADRMGSSAAILGHFSSVIEEALAGVRVGCGDVAGLLSGAAREIDLEQRLRAGLAPIVRQLREAGQAVGDADPALVRDDIQRMLGQHYTMASERVIHELFADNADHPCAPATPAGDPETVDVDSFFF